MWSRSTVVWRKPLRDVLAPFDGVTLHFGDALELDLAALDPPRRSRREPFPTASPQP